MTANSTTAVDRMRPIVAKARHAAARAVEMPGLRYNRVEAWWYDMRNHVETRGKASMRDMGTTGDAGEHGTGYQGVNARHFHKVFDSLAIPRDTTFIDIGAGKGKVVLLAAKAGFRRVVGVDVVESLCDVARTNVATLGPLAARCEIVACDALQYGFTDENVFFLNNPFDADFLAAMLDRIDASLAARPRPAWLVYANPSWLGAIARHPVWTGARRFHLWGPGRDMVVFAYEAPRGAGADATSR